MKTFAKNILLIICSIIFSLILSEILLRIIGFRYTNFYEYDDIVGARLHPGSEGWFSKEGRAYIKINSKGLRDREHSLEKPSDTIRIAVLGDSYAEAMQLPIEETFWYILEQELNHCKAFDDKKVEVINFGVSGYGTAQEFLTLRHYVWEYSPDIVILAFLTGNDIRNNSKALEPDKLKPFFHLSDGRLILDDSFTNDPVYKLKINWLWSMRRFLKRSFRSLQLLYKAKEIMDVRKNQTTDDGLQGEEIGLDNYIYLEPEDPYWQQAWEITQALIVNIEKEVESKNARFVLAILSNNIQVHPDPEARKVFMERLGTTDLFYADKRIESFCKDLGIEVISLAPIFQSYSERNKVFLHGFENHALGGGHWNKNGHYVAGKIIAQYLCRSDTPNQ